MQHNEIKASFEHNIHIVGHTFNVQLYKRLRGFVSRYTLNHIANEVHRMQFIGVDMSRYGCIVRSTHGLPYAYELARYALGTIPHQAIHLYWTRLSFNDLGSTNLNEEFSVQQEFDVITKCLKEVDIANNITIKNKLCEIAFSDLTFTCPPVDKVKSKGSQKGHAGKFARSMKCHPSFFEHVDALRSQHDSSSSWKSPGTSSQQSAHKRKILMLDQFHGNLHPYISDIVDVGSDGHCGYRAVATLLSIGEDSWPLVYNDLHKEL